MARVENWPQRLMMLIDMARIRPFIWGLHDCPTFAFETRMILTGGEDTAALWRGRYTTALGGERVMRRLGWSSLEDMGRALLGEPRPAVRLAQRGDIVLADTGLGFGICIGSTAVGMAPEGLVVVPLVCKWCKVDRLPQELLPVRTGSVPSVSLPHFGRAYQAA